jgi:hypothetical protein
MPRIAVDVVLLPDQTMTRWAIAINGERNDILCKPIHYVALRIHSSIVTMLLLRLPLWRLLRFDCQQALYRPLEGQSNLDRLFGEPLRSGMLAICLPWHPSVTCT